MSLPLGIHLGDCVEVLRTFPEASVDAVVTDPPYGIGFMGHEWDQPGVEARRAGTTAPFAGGRPDPRPHVVGAAKLRESDLTRRAEGERDHTKTRQRAAAMHAGHYDLAPAAMRAFQEWTMGWAAEVLRVLKPGGHLVSFASTRTNHRHVCGIEDAGFEIRDSLVWMFGSGFPKSRDLGDGRGTALKPGYEPITLARKPFKGSASACVAEHGTGGLNIDACRIPTSDDLNGGTYAATTSVDGTSQSMENPLGNAIDREFVQPTGRWPPNAVLDEEAAAMLDEQSGVLVSGANPTRRGSDKFRGVYGDFAGQEECNAPRGVDIGGASRFFYCAKASRAERDAGLDDENDHSTVKPIDLMRWLVALVAPPGGVVLDPFMGSGTTGCAAALEDRPFIGIDREPRYVEISMARIRHWTPQGFQLDLLGEGAAT